MPAAPESPVVSQSEICRLLNVTPTTVQAWTRKGCPNVAKGGRGKASSYRVSDVVRWREEQARLAATGDINAMDMEEARRRKLAAEAASAEIDLDLKRGVVVEVDVALDEVGRGLDACRSKLLSLASRLAPQVAAEDDVPKCKALISEAINEALSELSARMSE